MQGQQEQVLSCWTQVLDQLVVLLQLEMQVAQQTDVAVSQEVTSRSWRPKRLQNPLREATEARAEEDYEEREGTREVVLLCSFSCERYSFRVFIICEGS